MDPHTLASLRRGIEAALIASVPQVLLTHAEERLLGLPRGEKDANIGPRLIERLAEGMDWRIPEDLKWLGASIFHFGYAALWGALYALAYEKRPVPPLAGGLALGGVIYAIAFPSWGLAVRTKTEQPAGDRSWQKSVLLATAAFSFGLGTALLYGRGPRKAENDVAAGMLGSRRPAAA